MLVGVVYSMLAISFGWHSFTADYLAPIGDTFLRLLKLFAIPLVLVSVVIGIASLPDLQLLRRLGWKTLGAYLATTVLALSLGIALAVAIQPGKTLSEKEIIKNRLAYERFAKQAGMASIDGQWWSDDPQYAHLLLELEAESYQSTTITAINNVDSVGFLSTTNGALLDGFRFVDGHFIAYHGGELLHLKGTIQIGDEFSVRKELGTIQFAQNNKVLHQVETVKGFTENLEKKAAHKPKKGLDFLVDVLVPDNLFSAMSDIRSLLKVIVFGLLLGLALLLLPASQAAPLLALASSLNDALLLLIDWLMRLAPVFVFALMAGTIVPLADSLPALLKVLYSLFSFSMVAILGFLILTYGIYPLLLGLLTSNWRYRHFFQQIWPAQSMAFSTSSSAATLPVTLRIVIQKLGISPAIANAVIPIGGTVNMDGTGLYQAVAIVFLAQWHGIDLATTDYLLMITLITLSSIGSAAVPSGGIVLLMVVLESMGLNSAWIAIILPMDRLLDMARTVVNVTGDIVVSSIIHHSEKKGAFL